MNKKLQLINLLAFLMLLNFSSLQASVDWVGNMFPTSGSTSTINTNQSLDVYVQVFQSGVTEGAGQGAGVTCELYFGSVANFGDSWSTITSIGMSYNVDKGNNDEYTATFSGLPVGRYEYTCRCSSDGGANWTFASLGSGNARLEVTAAPLPVELSSFTAKRDQKQAVVLNWMTASEWQNDHFVVEQSNDLTQWNAIGRVEGAGDHLGAVSYQFVDQKAPKGIAYYRLNQKDTDGKSNLSEIISIDPLEAIYARVGPNPARDYLRLQTEVATAGTYQVQVINASGQVLLNRSEALRKATTVQLDVSSLPAGLYWLRLQNETGTTQGFQEIFVKL